MRGSRRPKVRASRALRRASDPRLREAEILVGVHSEGDKLTTPAMRRAQKAVRHYDTGGEWAPGFRAYTTDERQEGDFAEYGISGPLLKNANFVGWILSAAALLVAMLVSLIFSDWAILGATLAAILVIWSVPIVILSLLLALHSPVPRLMAFDTILTSTFRSVFKFVATPILLLVGALAGFYLQFNADDLRRKTPLFSLTESELAFFSMFRAFWTVGLLLFCLTMILIGFKLALRFWMLPLAARYRACVEASRVLPRSVQGFACRRINELTTPLAVFFAWLLFTVFVISLVPIPNSLRVWL